MMSAPSPKVSGKPSDVCGAVSGGLWVPSAPQLTSTVKISSQRRRQTQQRRPVRPETQDVGQKSCAALLLDRPPQPCVTSHPPAAACIRFHGSIREE